jgi:lactoylglutathione lyase
MKYSYFIVIILITLLVANGLIAQNNSPKSGARLNHIALYVQDLQRATQFYSNVVGLDTIPEPFHDGRHTWYLIGPKSHLHIISGVVTAVPKEKNTHLCFTVASVEDFILRLTQSHVPYESWTGEKMAYTKRVDGVKQIYFQDPDGYWIEINDARE